MDIDFTQQTPVLRFRYRGSEAFVVGIVFKGVFRFHKLVGSHALEVDRSLPVSLIINISLLPVICPWQTYQTGAP